MIDEFLSNLGLELSDNSMDTDGYIITFNGMIVATYREVLKTIEKDFSLSLIIKIRMVNPSSFEFMGNKCKQKDGYRKKLNGCYVHYEFEKEITYRCKLTENLADNIDFNELRKKFIYVIDRVRKLMADFEKEEIRNEKS